MSKTIEQFIARQLNLNEVQYKTNLALSRTHENAGNVAAALVHFQAFHQIWQNIHEPLATRQIQRILTKKEFKKARHLNLKDQFEGHADLDSTSRQNVSLPPRKLKQIIETINHNVERKFVLNELAQIAGLNRHYFVRSFKQATGKTPHQYFIERRVSRAPS